MLPNWPCCVSLGKMKVTVTFNVNSFGGNKRSSKIKGSYYLVVMNEILNWTKLDLILIHIFIKIY